jgi:hypothetical protein
MQPAAHNHSGQIRFADAGSGWEGYAAQNGLGEYRSISGSWTMPQVTCNTVNDMFAPWVGLDGLGNYLVEQTGLEVDCASGSAVMKPWFELAYNGGPVPGAIPRGRNSGLTLSSPATP